MVVEDALLIKLWEGICFSARREQSLSACVECYFAPLGLVPFPTGTHGLRRGLHSYAASRLA